MVRYAPEQLSETMLDVKDMTPTFHLYIDDSGSRSLDKNAGGQSGSKWFALGGVLIAEEDEPDVRSRHEAFCGQWGILYPLHSYDIRQQVKAFSWLNTVDASKRQSFLEDLTGFLMAAPVWGTACVIDRAGYDDRYREKYGRNRWELAKTAFSIVVERAAKFAQSKERRLKVYYERSDRATDRQTEGYFKSMKLSGMPFNAESSAQYNTIEHKELSSTLWDCKGKTKASAIMQLADLYLFPLCVSGYDTSYRAYLEMVRCGRTIDCILKPEERAILGVKYSCFDAAK